MVFSFSKRLLVPSFIFLTIIISIAYGNQFNSFVGFNTAFFSGYYGEEPGFYCGEVFCPLETICVDGNCHNSLLGFNASYSNGKLTIVPECLVNSIGEVQINSFSEDGVFCGPSKEKTVINVDLENKDGEIVTVLFTLNEESEYPCYNCEKTTNVYISSERGEINIPETSLLTTIILVFLIVIIIKREKTDKN